MAERRPIKCDLCGYEFRLISRIETKYYDYEPHQEECFYPDPKDPNPAHLVKNYICDDCYQKFGEIIRNNLINEGELFVHNLDSRLELLLKEFEAKKKALELENEKIKEITEKMKSISSISDFDEELMDEINKYQYHPFRNYYLDSAYHIENERKYNKRKVSNWLYYFNLSGVSLPENVSYGDIVDLKEFRTIFKACRFKDMSIGEIENVISRINSEIDKK